MQPGKEEFTIYPYDWSPSKEFGLCIYQSFSC